MTELFVAYRTTITKVFQLLSMYMYSLSVKDNETVMTMNAGTITALSWNRYIAPDARLGSDIRSRHRVWGEIRRENDNNSMVEQCRLGRRFESMVMNSM